MSYSKTVINVKDYGATGVEANGDVLTALQNAWAAVPEGGTLLIPDGYYPVSATWELKSRNKFLDCRGWIVPHSTFDDYLVYFARENPIASTQRGATAVMNNVLNLNVDGKFQSRGIRFYRNDCSIYSNVLCTNIFGTALDIDRVLETSFKEPRILGCKNRQRWSTPSDWNSGTSYSVGNRVKLAPAAYAGATVYTYNSIVRAADGFDYISIAVTHSGNTPETSPAFWRRIPFECYECLIAHTNQDPNTRNSNNSTPANRYWLRVYQEEAMVEINDDIQDVTDRTNQVTFTAVDWRDWTNLVGIRIDQNRADSTTTGITFVGGHVHYMDSSAVSTYTNKGYTIALQTDTAVVELGRVNDINFDRTQLRATTADRAQVVRMGGRSGGTKSTQGVRINAKLSGEGADQVGVLCLPSCIVNGGDSYPPSFISMDGSNGLDIYDPNKFFGIELRGQVEINLPQYSSAPTAIGISHPTSTSVNILSYTQEGDSFSRFILQALGVLGSLRFGDGASSADTGFRREGANLLAMLADDTFKVDGVWNGGLLRVGALRIWADTTTSQGRWKWGSDPTTETDGTLI